MRIRTGLVTAGLAVAVMAGLGGTATAATSDRASSAPAASWTGTPGCKFKADRNLSVHAKRIDVSKRRLKEALVLFEQKAFGPHDDIIHPAEVKWFANKLGVTTAKASPIIWKEFGGKPCKAAHLDEAEWFAQELEVTEAEAEAVLGWARGRDGEFIEINPKNRKCVWWAKKLHTSPKRLVAELEELRILKQAGE